MPNYKLLERIEGDDELEQFDFFSLGSEESERRGVVNSFDDTTIFTFTNQSEDQTRALYRHVFTNMGRYSSNTLVYPYSLTYSGEEVKNFPDGSFINLEGETSSSFQYFGADGELNFHRSRALYDTSIAVMKVEAYHNDIYKDLFYESDVYCSMTVTYLNHWGVECIRAADFTEGGSTKLVFLNVTDIHLLTTENFGVLVLPDIILGTEDLIVEVLGEERIEKIVSFVNDGGLIYASAKSVALLESFGLFPRRSYYSNWAVYSQSNVATVKGCYNPDSNPDGSNPNSFVKQLLCFGPEQEEVYMLSSYRLRNFTLDDPDVKVLGYFDPSDPNLRVRRFDTGQTYDAWSTLYLPYLLHKPVGKGNIVLNMANPGYHSDYFGWFYNALFLAMGKPVAYTQEVDFANGQAIPAGESGIRLSVNTSIHNIFNIPLEDVDLFYWIPKNTAVLSISGVSTWKELDLGYSPNSDVNQTGYIFHWDQFEAYSSIEVVVELEILDSSVTQKGDNVVMSYSILYFNDSSTDYRQELPIGSLLVDTKMAALLRASVNPDPSSFYPIPGEGAYIDNVMPVENKEDTLAYDVKHVAIVPLVSPAVDGNDQSKVIEILTFWNEYYDQSVNCYEDYNFPFACLDPRDHDVIDFKFLVGKSVYLNAEWDTAVKTQKMDRDSSFPTVVNVTSINSLNYVNYSTTITNTEQVLKQQYYADSDSFYEHATQQLLVFIDTTTEEGAAAKYGDIHSVLDESDIRPGTDRAKTEYSFIRSDVYFYNSLGEYVMPLGVNYSHVFSVDKYPLYSECSNENARVVVEGYFNKTLGGLKYNEYGNEVLNRCDKVHVPDVQAFMDEQGLDSVEKTRYLMPVNDDNVKLASDLKGFNETSGELFEYPEVRFVNGYRFVLGLDPAYTYRGGYLDFTLPSTCTFDDPDDEGTVFFSADHIAFYETEVDGRHVTAYFKRGLLSNENNGKESIQQVFFDHMVCSPGAPFNLDVAVYELKYDITLEDREEYIEWKTFTVEVEDYTFISLPAIKMTFLLNRTGDTSMKEYELIEPMIRYGVYYQELLNHRTVWGLAESHLVSDPGQVSKSGGFSLISQVGISSIPFLEYLTVGSGQVIPAGLETSRIEWSDIWNRRWIQPLRSVFPDVPPIPPPLRNFMMSTTFEVTKKGTTERVFEWDSETDEELDIFVKIKLKNNYPKYFEITTCQADEIYSEEEEVSSRVFDEPPYSYQTTSDSHYPDEYLSLGHRSYYGDCIQTGDILSMEEVPSSYDSSKLYLCSQNLEDVASCVIDVYSLPTITKGQDGNGTKWNHITKVENYYPTDYIKTNMWDLTHYDYDDNAFDKAYKYHMDNNLPSIDKKISKPHNIIAQPIWEGYGFQITYDKEYSVARYPDYQGWWSENLQNKDHTVLAGHSRSNDYSVDKDSDDLIPAWIDINDLEDTETEKFDRVAAAQKNIYVCLFNRHRIRMSTQTSKNVYETNIYQNNVIPIIPDLDINDARYSNYDCDLSEDQYTPDELSQIDNRIYSSDSRDWLYFASNLRGGAKETINVVTKLKAYEDRTFEGDTKVNDGGRFVYWNPANGPNSFLIVDNPVNVIKSSRCDIDFEIALYPQKTSTFDADVYHLVTIQDAEEIDRQYTMSSYINHYGFGDVTTSIYVGGTKGSTAFISEDNPTTYVKITIYNNAGFDFNMFASAIDFDYEGSMPLNANDLLYDLVHAIKVPTAYNFMTVNVPSELQPYIDIIPSDHNKYVSSLFFDFQNINVVQILDGFKGDYFYKISIKDGVTLPDSLKGKLHELTITFNEEHFESLPNYNSPLEDGYHDYHIQIPSIKFGIPFGSSAPDYQGKVYYNLGQSSDVTFDIPLSTLFAINEEAVSAKFITSDEILDLQTAAGGAQEGMSTALSNLWNSLADDGSGITFTTATEGMTDTSGNEYNVVHFDISGRFDVFPKRLSDYAPPTAVTYLLLKTHADYVPFGSNVVDYVPYLEYDACQRGTVKTESLFTLPVSRSITAKGAFLVAEYEYEILSKVIEGEEVEVTTNQNLYPHDSGTMVAATTVTNTGSDVAYNFNVSLHFAPEPEIVVMIDYMEENAPFGYSYYLNKSSDYNILTVSTMVDLSPGNMEMFDVYLQFAPEAGVKGQYDYSTIDEERSMTSPTYGVMQLSNDAIDHVQQKLDNFVVPYTLRSRDTVELNEIEKNNGDCWIELEAVANYPTVDDELIYYNFYFKNHSETEWVFIERTWGEPILKHYYACGEATDYRVVTQDRTTEMELALGDYELSFIPWAAIALSMTLTVVVAGAVLLFSLGMLILCAFIMFGFFTAGGVKGFKESVQEFKVNNKKILRTWKIKGSGKGKEEEFETVNAKYFVRGQFIDVVEKVKKERKLPPPPPSSKNEEDIPQKKEEVKRVVVEPKKEKELKEIEVVESPSKMSPSPLSPNSSKKIETFKEDYSGVKPRYMDFWKDKDGGKGTRRKEIEEKQKKEKMKNVRFGKN